MRPAKNPFHPGEILLEEFLVPAGITQAACDLDRAMARRRKVA